MRPLDRLRSIKVKLGVVIVAAVIVTLAVNEVGIAMNFKLGVRAAAAIVLGLVMVQLLARGMTSPLREMAAAASAMARGEHGRTVTASSRDEVGELARAFNGMAADLAEVDRLRRDLVANVSHELRTPIASLQVQLENLIDGVSTADEASLGEMLRQVTRLSSLVHQLLDLSRLEAGTVPLHRERVAVAALLHDAARDARLRAAELAIDVDVQPADLTVNADAGRLQQVITNLVDNAVRHTPPAGHVRLAARPGRHGVQISVSDEGPGIAPGEEQRIFERFYRSDAARTSSEGGSGLGLAITRWIVELHGGSIRPERLEPTGVEMIVELPGLPA